MLKRQTIIRVLLALYSLGLIWGQVRLPVAAVKSLSDYDLLCHKPNLSAPDERLQMWVIQKWYLKRSLKLIDGVASSVISAKVMWNFGFVARVNSGHYSSPTGSESLDALYVCIFGAWLKIYTFNHLMA